MSLGKFLKKIWAAIASLFHSIDNEVKILLPVVYDIIEKMKTVDEAFGGDVLKFLLSTVKADPAIISKMEEYIPKILNGLAVVKSITDLPDDNAKLKAILAAINVSEDDAKGIFWHGIASLMLEKASDGKFDWSDSIAVMQYFHDHVDELKPQINQAA